MTLRKEIIKAGDKILRIKNETVDDRENTATDDRWEHRDSQDKMGQHQYKDLGNG